MQRALSAENFFLNISVKLFWGGNKGESVTTNDTSRPSFRVQRRRRNY